MEIGDKQMFTLHNQCHGSWWPGDTSSQEINSYGIDLPFPEYSDSAPEGF